LTRSSAVSSADWVCLRGFLNRLGGFLVHRLDQRHVAGNPVILNARTDFEASDSSKSCARSVPKSCAVPGIDQKVLVSFVVFLETRRA
jgi:hypothetical protein